MMVDRSTAALREPGDLGSGTFRSAMVNVTNACNLSCAHCFVFRENNPNQPHDRMDDGTMLHQLGVLRDRHGIRSMAFMGGEPMKRKQLVLNGLQLFERSSIITNGTYGIPSAPGHLVTVSLDGPEAMNDAIRGEGVFQKVKEAIFARDADDGTIVILQMVVTRETGDGMETWLQAVRDWPVSGAAFSFYAPAQNDSTGLGWPDLRDRDEVIERAIALKRRYRGFLTSNIGALEMMRSDVAIQYTGPDGEHCPMRRMLTLYMGTGGNFERTFCCLGNDVDCARCGFYGVFNAAFHRQNGS